MILVVCIPCNFGIRVMPLNALPGAIQELEAMVGRRSQFWPDLYSCPQCGGFMRGMGERQADVAAVNALNVRDLTPHEAFAAFHGVGLPEEQLCSFETVQTLLCKQRVTRVIGSNVLGSQRTIIDALELEDGTKVYFGAGGDGAVIYRITKPVSYTRAALAEAGETSL